MKKSELRKLIKEEFNKIIISKELDIYTQKIDNNPKKTKEIKKLVRDYLGI